MSYYNPAVRSRDAVVKGTGDASLDNSHLTAAVARLNAQGGGTLWIDGEVIVNGNHAFTAPVSLRGLHPDSALNVIQGRFSWASWLSTTGSPGTISNTAAFQSYIENPSITVNKGDWVAVWSNDEIEGIAPHYYTNFPATAKNCPEELHQVKDIHEGKYVFDDSVVDALTISPSVNVLPNPLFNVVVSDLTIRYTPSTLVTQFLFFYQCINLLVENITWEYGSSGYIVLTYCAGTKIRGCRYWGSYNNYNGWGYAIVANVVNGVVVSECDFQGVRHCFTTASSRDTSPIRWGTPRNCLVTNNRFCGSYNIGDSQSIIIMDTHAEGWGTVFSDNYIEAPSIGGAFVIGGSARARRTIFKHNTVTLTGDCRAFDIYADDCQVIGNTVIGGWRVCTTYSNGASTTNRCICKDNIGTRVDGGGMLFRGVAGSGHRIDGNLMYDCLAGNFIQLDSGTSNYQITNNNLTKGTNTTSIHMTNLDNDDVFIANNVCRGYGSGVAGFTSVVTPSGTPFDFETEYASINFTD